MVDFTVRNFEPEFFFFYCAVRFWVELKADEVAML
jgi:hypothetical protein